jgi:hypothetical protein
MKMCQSLEEKSYVTNRTHRQYMCYITVINKLLLRKMHYSHSTKLKNTCCLSHKSALYKSHKSLTCPDRFCSEECLSHHHTMGWLNLQPMPLKFIIHLTVHSRYIIPVTHYRMANLLLNTQEGCYLVDLLRIHAIAGKFITDK